MFHRLNKFASEGTTERLALRPLCLADSFPLFEATKNPEFNRHLLWAQPNSHDEVLERVRSLIALRQTGRQTSFCAVVKETGQFVSLFRLTPIDYTALEMGLWTHPSFWGGGYGTELTKAAIRCVFDYTEFKTVQASASADNPGACAVLRKCGMTPETTEARETESGGTISLMRYLLTK